MKTKQEIRNDDGHLRLIDKKQAAKILGTSTRTIEREASAGRLAKHKIRGCVRFLMADVLRLAGIANSNPLAS
jgi:excisionase family DNA binding protein